MFNIIARRTLNLYCDKYPDAREALRKWYTEMIKADYSNFNELKEIYPNASVLSDSRVVFNICGNKYRLIVRFNFTFRAIQVKWFGTHKEYDKTDAASINYKK